MDGKLFSFGFFYTGWIAMLIAASHKLLTLPNLFFSFDYKNLSKLFNDAQRMRWSLLQLDI
jgi:hypothetical protein